jgi:hypothetical protein
MKFGDSAEFIEICGVSRLPLAIVKIPGITQGHRCRTSGSELEAGAPTQLTVIGMCGNNR